MGVLIVGSSIEAGFSFQRLSAALASNLGAWASVLFALGLFAAGFSSAITAPLAAAITARSLFESQGSIPWHEKSWPYRATWLGVLVTGVAFGLADVKPIPAIILAQAFNGILLPLVAIFLFIVVNDSRVMGNTAINGIFANVLMGLVVAITVILGLSGLARALAATAGFSLPAPGRLLVISTVLTLLLAIPVGQQIHLRRKQA